jgi:hypothetical protein
VARTAKDFGIHFDNKGVVLKPEIREVLFLDTADFRLYNHAFIWVSSRDPLNLRVVGDAIPR